MALIEVVKIFKKEKYSSDSVVNPKNGDVIDGEKEFKYKFSMEIIQTNQIVTARPWKKDRHDEREVNGNMIHATIVGSDRKGKPAHMLINENYDEFCLRAGVKKMTDGEKKKTSIGAG